MFEQSLPNLGFVPVSTGRYFVGGVHTDVGKTHVACALLRRGRARGIRVDAFKPVVSGFDLEDWSASDPARLLVAMGRPLRASALDEVAPLRFSAPLAPPAAARREGRSVTLEELERLCRARLLASPAELFLIEGAGGVMSPLAEKSTCLDLMQLLSLPVVLVGGSYLGGISHLLTALESLKARGVRVAAVVLSESSGSDTPDFDETMGLVSEFTPLPVVGALRREDDGWADCVLDIIFD